MYANIILGNISLPMLIFTLQYNYNLLQVDFILVIRTDQSYCHFDIYKFCLYFNRLLYKNKIGKFLYGCVDDFG